MFKGLILKFLGVVTVLFFVSFIIFNFIPSNALAVTSYPDSQSTSLAALQAQVKQLLAMVQQLIMQLSQKNINNNSTSTQMCLADAKLCPDGVTYVGRSGPNCQFAACPAIVSPTTPIVPTTTPALFICSYPAPPVGCNYKQGPNFNPLNQCGLVLDCAGFNNNVSLKVLSPNGGEVWQRGSIQKIKWQGNESVNIDLINKNSTLTRIASGVSGGEYTWTVSDGLKTSAQTTVNNDYKIKISSGSPICTRGIPEVCTSPSDESDNYFSMIPSGACALLPMCAPPPQGMCYVVDQSNPCGCGKLQVCGNSSTDAISFPLRIISGRTTTYTDTQGRIWQPDSNYVSYLTGQSFTYQSSNNIQNTSDQDIYKNERWGGVQNSNGGYDARSFGYTFPVPNGDYTVVLKFAEIYFTTTGQRKENVYINNQKVLDSFDPSGGKVNTAVDMSFPVKVLNGEIKIQFDPVLSTPKVSAIEIYRTSPAALSSLKDLALNKNKNVGTAVAHYLLDNASEPLYSQSIKKEFNMIVPENELKMEYTQPNQGVFNADGSYRGSFDFSLMDKVVNFANANGLKVRATPLVWNSQLPSWLVNGNFSGSQLRSILENHVKTIVARYRGKISSWDVVNEVISDQGISIWEKINPQNPFEYIDLAFKWAREADPNAKLYLNEYGAEGLGTKSDKVFNLVSSLKSRNIPIDGVGLQSHFSLTSNQDIANLKANMLRLKNIGLDVEVTELDVWLPVTNGVASSANLQAQGPIYAQVAKACIESTNCKSLLTWGFTDKFSWIPYFVSGGGAALPFDVNYQPKPAYNSLLESFR